MDTSTDPTDCAPPPAALRRSSRHSSTATLLSLDTPLRPAKRRTPSPAELETNVKLEGGGQPGQKKRRSKGQYAHLAAKPLTDRIQDDLDILFCGENPGIRTAELQLHCASRLSDRLSDTRTRPRADPSRFRRRLARQPFLQVLARRTAHARCPVARVESHAARGLQRRHHEPDRAADERGASLFLLDSCADASSLADSCLLCRRLSSAKTSSKQPSRFSSPKSPGTDPSASLSFRSGRRSGAG